MPAAARLLAADEPAPVLLHPAGADPSGWAARGGPFLLAADPNLDQDTEPAAGRPMTASDSTLISEIRVRVAGYVAFRQRSGHATVA